MKNKKIITSPLRYPGSKQKFCNTLYSIISYNQLNPELFIEPFAGGASISLYMLQNNYVEEIGLIEKDPLVASFWKILFFDSEWLIKEINQIDISLEKWHYFKQYNPKTVRNKALKCLFLNRTSFSGILKAGPIGGKKQKSKYKIDCRFNKKNIIYKIKILSSYKDRVAFIDEGDYQIALDKRKEYITPSTFLYFDPPYVNKAKNLYNFYFNEQDHIRLSNVIQSLNTNWLLSYDYEPSISNLYKNFANYGFFNIKYTTSSSKNRVMKKEFIASNLKLDILHNI
ncbi:DNA adenine methylase [Hydrogenimonas thermophila]|uniref:DNA adenine methylase n=1 Tax=Hydrogenimonas thermophila TaxID=223786 RepID=UPI002936E948|nr:DNA adenine methylase [Hydrogenimonas thermophila]WOE68905.1 DNA adenine methylase [Hydrogenimonas thermophila]WOE71412.1 DNA adenine methylase [Hydrogenimonas thermophila]